VLLGYDTDKRLQKEGLTREYTLEEWVVEAGPAYFEDTVAGVVKGIAGAKKVAADRPDTPYARKKEKAGVGRDRRTHCRDCGWMKVAAAHETIAVGGFGAHLTGETNDGGLEG
jgi:hypothetical protein